MASVGELLFTYEGDGYRHVILLGETISSLYSIKLESTYINDSLKYMTFKEHYI